MDQPCSSPRDAAPRRTRARAATLVLLPLLAAVATVACRAATTPDPARVSADVVAALDAGREAAVVVALRLPPDVAAADADPSLRRAAIARVQADVLARLSPADYRAGQLFVAVPAMSGTVRTRGGLATLLAHPSVRRVDLDVGGTGAGAER